MPKVFLKRDGTPSDVGGCNENGEAEEHDEIVIVGSSYTVVEPLAMMIESIHTAITLRAMLRRFQTVRLT